MTQSGFSLLNVFDDDDDDGAGMMTNIFTGAMPIRVLQIPA